MLFSALVGLRDPFQKQQSQDDHGGNNEAHHAKILRW
jgi:hypothetical protein